MLRLSQIGEMYYPYIVVLDDVHLEERYIFLVSRLLKEMAQISIPNGYIEVYKVDIAPNQPPTLYLADSSNIDSAKLEVLFDRIAPLMHQAANNNPLTPASNQPSL